MIRAATDENFNNDVLRGLRRRVSTLDIVRVQDVGLCGASDTSVLEWTANAGRVLLTHDRGTIPAEVRERITKGLPVPGVIVVPQRMAIGQAVRELYLILTCSEPYELDQQTLHLPLRR